MGGNAFKDLNSIRLDKNNYMILATATIERLKKAYPNNCFNVIDSYRKKESFGDLDIIWCGPEIISYDVVNVIKASIFVKNGPVSSYAVKIDNDAIFQVDLIHVNCRHLESALSYFSYNDLGNLIGRVYHRAGFKLGHKGLLYIAREENNFSNALKEIEITTSWKKALEFAGYDYNRWLQGFDDLEDVFRYAVSNSLANRTIFRLDETNHAARVRDRKRETYQKFLKWVNDPVNNIKDHEDISKLELRNIWLKRAKLEFPVFAKELEKTQMEMRLARKSKNNFNGNIVKEITGLDGKELGTFIQDFIHNYINKETKMTTVDWVLSHTKEQIKQAISNWWINYD